MRNRFFIAVLRNNSFQVSVNVDLPMLAYNAFYAKLDTGYK